MALSRLMEALPAAVSRVPGADGVLGADGLDYFRLAVDHASRQLTLDVIHLTASPKEYPVDAIVDPGADGD